MGKIAHTRTPLNNREPTIIIMHIIGKKNRKKKKKTEKRKKKGKRKKEKKIYIYIINKKGNVLCNLSEKNEIIFMWKKCNNYWKTITWF